MIKIPLEQHPTLCHMAWDYPMFFMFTNSFGYCCRAPRIGIDNTDLNLMREDYFSNHPKFVERRKALLNGIKHPDCNTCWQLEDAGFKSSRSHSKLLFSKNDEVVKNNLSLPFSEFKDVPNFERSNYTNVIEIVLNNTCDAKCTYCSEFYSTQWLTEKKKYKEVSLKYVPQDNRNLQAEELFWSWYEKRAISTNRRFGFIGGEPFIIDELYQCFDKLIEIHSRINVEPDPIHGKMEICITSNLNTPPAYFEKFLNYIPKLEKYFNIIIQVSGENTGSDLEYIRNGVKWDRWSSNVEYLLKHTNVTLAFLPCLSLLTIPRFHLYLEYFANLCKNYRYMKIHYNIVSHPIEQSPMIAPKEFAVYFDRCTEIILDLMKTYHKRDSTMYAYNAFLQWLYSVRESITKNQSEHEVTDNAIKFYNYVSKLDSRRNTNVLQVFPEFTKFYNSGKQDQ